MMGVVHNTQYFIWFELGRFALIDEVLSDAPKWRDRVSTPVVMNVCNYLEPARLGDELIITTKHAVVPSWTGRLRFLHTISNTKTKAELAHGQSELTLVDADTFRPIKEFPQTLWKSYQNLR